MSKWNHTICSTCWEKKNPGREAARVIDGVRELCCYCGESTTSGIFVRDDPATLRCKGEHGDD